MLTVNALHTQAMDIAENAFLSQRRGDRDAAKRLFLEALSLEQQAAFMLEAKSENEPSRSVLFRSAASLAFNGFEYELAEKLVAHGLSGYPPIEIADELRDLFDEVNFMRHLSTKGMGLSSTEWKMTLTGAAISKGIVEADQLLTRADKVSTLVRRTVERKLHLPFRVNRTTPDVRRDQYGLFLRALMPSSFAVIFRLGQPDQQLSFLSGDLEPQEVVDELLVCLEHLQFDNVEKLKERIGDPDYFDNFVGLAKQIAPDGKDVKSVGFTVVRDGQDKPLLVRKTRQDIKISVSKALPKEDEPEESLVLEGILTFADTPIGRNFGKVKLRQENGKDYHEIKVPIGLMKDVVQPYYDERVSVTVVVKNGKFYLEDLNK